MNDLAGAANEALETAEQETLDGTNLAKVSFLGMSWEPSEVPDLKDEVTFIVKGRVIEAGDKVMADGSIRHLAKVKVMAVIREAD